MVVDAFAFLLFFLAGVAMVVAGHRMQVKARQAQTWPTVQGTIVDITFDDSSDPTSSSATTCQTNVRYSFVVAGRQFEASRIAFGYSANRNRQAEFALYSRLKQAGTVTVRYNPAQPSEASLEYVSASSARGLQNFGLLWVVLTVVFYLVSVSAPA
jgi:hypothetical protein